MDNREALNAVVEEYEKLRSDNKRRRDLKVSEVYKKVPEIEEIDKEISKIGSSTLQKILTSPDKKGLKEDMHNKFTVLKQRRRELLISNSIPLDFDKIKYRCNECCDTGYIEGKGKCSCFKQSVLDRLYKQSNMSEMIREQNFDTFDISYYSESDLKGQRKTPRKNMENIRDYCLEYVENFDNDRKSLCFYGDTGLGKTFMSCCVAKALIDNGKSVLYLRAQKLLKMILDDQFGKEVKGLEDIYDCDMLIIDDLGTENDSKYNTANLIELINERISKNKKTLINTNLIFKGLEDRYSKRITSRMIENYNFIFFYGDDIRQIKGLR